MMVATQCAEQLIRFIDQHKSSNPPSLDYLLGLWIREDGGANLDKVQQDYTVFLQVLIMVLVSPTCKNIHVVARPASLMEGLNETATGRTFLEYFGKDVFEKQCWLRNRCS